jgi:preprotein translocase subunit SecG
MIEIILIFHLIIAIAMVISVLLQRSEGGALGMGGGGGTMGGLMTTRGSANLLTRATAVLATIFMSTSILLAIMSGAGKPTGSIMDQPAAVAPAQPELPKLPSVPLAK